MNTEPFYQRRAVPADWRPGSAPAENPGDPRFHGEAYASLLRRHLAKVVHDPTAVSLMTAHGATDQGLGVANARRAALGQPLFHAHRPEAALIAHLEGCAYCQRLVTLFREALQELAE